MICWSLFAVGCTGHLLPYGKTSELLKSKQFVMVKAGSADTLEKLAQTYLHSADKAWRIADYNGINELTAGQRTVVPLKPIVPGGLQANGYQTVPILTYTRLTKKSSGDTRTGFGRQMQYLKTRGYTTVSLDQLYAFLQLEDDLPPRAVVVTFDTSRPWVFEIAYPILKQNRMKAALFVATSAIGRPGFLSWAQLRQWTAAGFDVASRGRSGRSLMRINPRQNADERLQWIEKEIIESRKTLSRQLKRPCHYFAYPQGDINDLIIALLKKHGYRAAFTRQRGDNPFFVDDFKINRALISERLDMDAFEKETAVFQTVKLK